MLNESQLRRRLRNSVPYYAQKCLKIRTKSSAIQPLILNSAQQHVHRLLEEQRRRIGYVRAMVIKGRQQGISTYVQGRFFHHVTHDFGVKAFILTHLQDSTDGIFEMADLFVKSCPQELLPVIGKSNAKELSFPGLRSGYAVSTAGTKDVGRSSTLQLFHGSEVAFWPNAEAHGTGILQCVPDEPGTEIILESTIKGPIGYFQDKWRTAQQGESDYQCIFVPWFWQSEYRRHVGPDFEMTAEEMDYANRFELEPSQIAWRRHKAADMGGMHKFRQEYPSTIEEAFSAENPGALWTRKLIDRYRVDEVPKLRLMVVAVDPSANDGKDADECGIVWGGIGVNDHVYVFGDESGVCRPIQWTERAVRIYNAHRMERLVYEANQGGQMVADLISVHDRHVSMASVHASRGKRARAEPVSSLYEKGLVHHVGHLHALEDEMCTWDASESRSPNRIDALVWMLSYLVLRPGSHLSRLGIDLGIGAGTERFNFNV